jgi:osmotically-inducible protein OsmY
MRSAISFLAGAATGAAAAYFLDPAGGARRRNETREQALSTVKSTAADVAGTAKHAGSRAQGAVRSASPSIPGTGGGGEPENDVTLARKVETEIFRSDDAPKGDVSVNAENGVVFLRGVVADQAWIDRLGAEAEGVDGVKAVRNLLHLPGTPAPAAPATQ